MDTCGICESYSACSRRRERRDDERLPKLEEEEMERCSAFAACAAAVSTADECSDSLASLSERHYQGRLPGRWNEKRRLTPCRWEQFYLVENLTYPPYKFRKCFCIGQSTKL